MNSWILKVKRAETPFFRCLKLIARFAISPTTPRVPSLLKPLLRFTYQLHWTLIIFWRLLASFYRRPLFESRCTTFGRNVTLDGFPFVSGHAELYIGNHCYLGGKLSITSSRILDHPRFVMQDHSEVGWNVQIVCNSEVILEEHARVSYDCRISDSDGHPRQADLRALNLPMDKKDIRPIRIGRHAWVGNGTHIMKGVTIGEGAIIGANSVVINDIPPYCLALGNPAEVLLRNYGKPSKTTPPASSTSAKGQTLRG